MFAGYMPWGYAHESGVMKKWADKYGLTIDLVPHPDYVYSITAYANGEYDACAMTNIDALVSPAGAGVDTTAILPLDYSDGADAVVMKGGAGIKDLAGQAVFLVQYSVSHYLLNRALESAGLTEADVAIIDTPDKDIVKKFANAQVRSAVSWNPLLPALLKEPGAQNVFDSSNVPGEIIDIMAVNTATLKDNPGLGMALAGAWFEVMDLVSRKDERGAAVRAAMAKTMGADLAGLEAQFESLRFLPTPAHAAAFLESAALPAVMDSVRKFLFTHQLLGPQIASADSVGISFPGGKVLGAADNIRLRFDSEFVRKTAEGGSRPAPPQP